VHRRKVDERRKRGGLEGKRERVEVNDRGVRGGGALKRRETRACD
jgi:hypothetical protein